MLLVFNASLSNLATSLNLRHSFSCVDSVVIDWSMSKVEITVVGGAFFVVLSSRAVTTH